MSGKKKEKLGRDALQQLLLQEDQEEIQKCNKKIEVALKEHGCVLVPVIQLYGQQIFSTVQIVRVKNEQ